MECLGLYNKPKAEAHLGHKLTDPKEEDEDLCAYVFCINSGIRSLSNFLMIVHLFASAAINFIIYLTGT